MRRAKSQGHPAGLEASMCFDLLIGTTERQLSRVSFGPDIRCLFICYIPSSVLLSTSSISFYSDSGNREVRKLFLCI